MAGRRAGTGLALAAVALSAAGCGLGSGSATTVTQTVTRTVTQIGSTTITTTAAALCAGNQLSATFTNVPGSQGAGQVAYTLTLSNTSLTACALTVEKVVLLGASDTPLPTKTFGALPVGSLAPGASAQATARFSPSVPGTGDSQSGSCQPKAFALQVTPSGGGIVNAPLKPPSSVCEQGSLTLPSN